MHVHPDSESTWLLFRRIRARAWVCHVCANTLEFKANVGNVPLPGAEESRDDRSRVKIHFSDEFSTMLTDNSSFLVFVSKTAPRRDPRPLENFEKALPPFYVDFTYRYDSRGIGLESIGWVESFVLNENVPFITDTLNDDYSTIFIILERTSSTECANDIELSACAQICTIFPWCGTITYIVVPRNVRWKVFRYRGSKTNECELKQGTRGC